MLATAGSSRAPLPVTVVAALVALIVSLGVGAGSARAASVTVTTTPESPPVPTGFIGISTQYKALEQYTGSDPEAIDPAFLNLLADAAPGQPPVLRIGGESADWSWYPVSGQQRPPGVNYTITPDWLKVARATAQDLDGRLILGLNLEAGNRTDTVGEARAMLSTIGRRYITALEIGNEPELYHHFAWYHNSKGAPVYGRPASWSPSRYRAEFSRFAGAMPKVRIAGPASGLGTWLDQLGTFLRDEPAVGLTTIHAYPLKHCRASHKVSIPNVLARSAAGGFVSELAPYVRTSRRAGRPIRIDELNAITCGGTEKVSNSFATALWMIDTLFGLARTGAGGVNINSVPGAINSVLDPASGHGAGAISVQPEYYAMMMFAQAAPPGARMLRVRAALPPDVQAWATRDRTGTVRVVLVDKSARDGTTATLRVPAAAGPATVERLHARGLGSTADVTLGGQTFGAATTTGTLTGPAQRRLVTPAGGAYTVALPAASAEMVTFTPPPGSLLMSALSDPGALSSLLSSW